MPDTLDTPRAKNIALALLAMTQFMVIIDASIVNVALPSIGRALDIGEGNLSWVANAYTLTFGGFLLLGGRLADYLGRKRMFMAGLGLFALASLAGGLAQSEGWLFAARAVQGLGAAIVSPAALAIITTTFAEGSERNRALGVWGAVAGAGGAAGVLFGGILTDGLGWEWVLFVNVPIAAVVMLLAPARLAESRLSRRGSFDVLGAIAITAALALLVYAFVDTQHAGWTSSDTIGRILVGVVLLAAFVVIELRSARPLVPFGIFRLRTLRGANVIGVLLGMALYSMFFFISLYVQKVIGFSALKTGLGYLPLSISIILAAGVASQLVTRIGFKPTLALGLVVVTIGIGWFTQISPGGSYAADVLGPSILAGIGLGLSFVTVTIAAVTGTTPDQAGLASGLVNTSQQVGGALGLAVLSSIATHTSDNVGSRDPHVILTEGFQDAFTVGAAFALVGVVLTLVLISSRDSREHAAAARAGEATPAAA